MKVLRSWINCNDDLEDVAEDEAKDEAAGVIITKSRGFASLRREV